MCIRDSKKAALKTEKIKYFGKIITENEVCVLEIDKRIRSGWISFKNTNNFIRESQTRRKRIVRNMDSEHENYIKSAECTKKCVWKGRRLSLIHI